MSKELRECAWCGNPILAKGNRIYCDEHCRKSAAFQKNFEKRAAKDPIKRNCKTCGDEFEATTSLHLYCTDTCRPSRKRALQKAKEKHPPDILLRWKVLNRDGFRCQYCGRNPTEDGVKLHVDHIKPKADGGKSELENLVTACEDCNYGKYDRPLRHEAEFKARIRRKKREFSKS